jgi:hypothetical protein
MSEYRREITGRLDDGDRVQLRKTKQKKASRWTEWERRRASASGLWEIVTDERRKGRKGTEPDLVGSTVRACRQGCLSARANIEKDSAKSAKRGTRRAVGALAASRTDGRSAEPEKGHGRG